MNDRPVRFSVLSRLPIAAVLAAYLAHAALYIRHVNDDAFITFRYGRFLASGLGPYFNAGEHVEGYTNFLHMLLMAAVYAIGGERAVPTAAKALGITAGALALMLVYLICRSLVRESPSLSGHGVLAGSLAAALVAVFPGFALNSTSGLETLLFGMLVTLGVYLGMLGRREGRWRGAGAAWAAAALTRPEGALAFGVYWICTALASLPRISVQRPTNDTGSRQGRSDFRRAVPGHLALDALVVVLVLAAHLLFRVLAYDGELLPNTYYAKAEGYLGYTPWAYVRQGALAPFLGTLGVVVGLAGWWRTGGLLRSGLPMVGVALFGAFLPFLVGSDWMPGWRFSVPYLPLLGATVAIGWTRLLQPLIVRSKILGPAVVLIGVTALAAWHHGERLELADQIRLRADGYATGHLALAAWIRDDVGRTGDSVALMDIGIVGYYCPEQRILDITGLTDRYIAKRPGPLLAKQYDPAYVLDQRPEMVVLVFTALGDPSEPLPEDAKIATWIRSEGEILGHPEFRAHYQRVPGAGPAALARFGAERVFEHAHPGQYYLLAAFRRREESSGSAPASQTPPPGGTSVNRSISWW